MGEFTRYSLTGVLYFPYASRGNLGAYLAKFTRKFKKFLLSTSLFDSEEFSVSIDKVNDLNFIPRTEDKDRFSLSYHISILAHVDSVSHADVDRYIHTALRDALTKSQAGLVIFSSVSEQKDSKHMTVRLGSYYHFNKQTGLVYTSVSDYHSKGGN